MSDNRPTEARKAAAAMTTLDVRFVNVHQYTRFPCCVCPGWTEKMLIQVAVVERGNDGKWHERGFLCPQCVAASPEDFAQRLIAAAERDAHELARLRPTIAAWNAADDAEEAEAARLFAELDATDEEDAPNEDRAAPSHTDPTFGLCPVCHQADGYRNLGRDQWFYCEAHQVRWLAGSNLFSSWQHENDEDRARDTAFLLGLRVVAPFFGDDVEAVTPLVNADLPF